MKSTTMVTLMPRWTGFGLDAVDLVVVAVDEGDPGALVVGVTSFGFVEDLSHDDRRRHRPRWR